MTVSFVYFPADTCWTPLWVKHHTFSRLFSFYKTKLSLSSMKISTNIKLSMHSSAKMQTKTARKTKNKLPNYNCKRCKSWASRSKRGLDSCRGAAFCQTLTTKHENFLASSFYMSTLDELLWLICPALALCLFSRTNNVMALSVSIYLRDLLLVCCQNHLEVHRDMKQCCRTPRGFIKRGSLGCDLRYNLLRERLVLILLLQVEHARTLTLNSNAARYLLCSFCKFMHELRMGGRCKRLYSRGKNY